MGREWGGGKLFLTVDTLKEEALKLEESRDELRSPSGVPYCNELYKINIMYLFYFWQRQYGLRHHFHIIFVADYQEQLFV